MYLSMCALIIDLFISFCRSLMIVYNTNSGNRATPAIHWAPSQNMGHDESPILATQAQNSNDMKSYSAYS